MSTTALQQPHLALDTKVPRPRLLQRIWNALEAQGQRRAAAELRRLSLTFVSTDPDLKRALREAADYASRA